MKKEIDKKKKVKRFSYLEVKEILDVTYKLSLILKILIEVWEKLI